MKVRKLVLILLILCMQFIFKTQCFSQEQISEIDSLFKGISVNLTPEKPHATRDFSFKLYKEICLLLRDDNHDFRNYSYLYENDSIVIRLKSGESWELFGEVPKAPLFWLFRFFLNKNNEKVIYRFNYLKFNSVCEQKPELAYKLIDSLTLYQNERGESNLLKKKFVCNMKYDSQGNLYIVE